MFINQEHSFPDSSRSRKCCHMHAQVSELSSQPALDFMQKPEIDIRHREVCFVKHPLLRDDFLLITYNSDIDSRGGRTLILYSNGQMVKTDRTPMQLINTWAQGHLEVHPLFRFMNFYDFEGGLMPVVFHDLVAVPVRGGNKSYRTWLGLNEIGHFLNPYKGRARIQFESRSGIFVRLESCFDMLYMMLFCCLVIWSYQTELFRTLKSFNRQLYMMPQDCRLHVLSHLLNRLERGDYLHQDTLFKQIMQDKTSFDSRTVWRAAEEICAFTSKK